MLENRTQNTLDFFPKIWSQSLGNVKRAASLPVIIMQENSVTIKQIKNLRLKRPMVWDLSHGLFPKSLNREEQNIYMKGPSEVSMAELYYLVYQEFLNHKDYGTGGGDKDRRNSYSASSGN